MAENTSLALKPFYPLNRRNLASEMSFYAIVLRQQLDTTPTRRTSALVRRTEVPFDSPLVGSEKVLRICSQLPSSQCGARERDCRMVDIVRHPTQVRKP